jgi:nitrous oxide reductase accessory protein NosL
MDRKEFSHSRMLITYEAGSATAVCSLHCAALDLALNIGRKLKKVEVGDYATRQLVDAEGAQWVLGGNKPGVMSRRAKWAFLGKDSAMEFVKENEGKLTDFSGALKASYEDMYDDVAMLRNRRAARR